MRVYQHRVTGDLVIVWQVYAKTGGREVFPGLVAEMFSNVGVASENKNDVTCVFPESTLEHFEYIGDF